MKHRSYPMTLIYEGVIQRAISIVAPEPCPSISVYGLSCTNELISLGTLADGRINIDSKHRIAVVWFEYDTDVVDYDIVDSIDLIIDGSYSLRNDHRTA
jgi:hypothetical protein